MLVVKQEIDWRKWINTNNMREKKDGMEVSFGLYQHF